MICLTHEVGQSKPHIETWISEMNHFVVKQNQFAPIDQRIFRAEVAVNQAVSVMHCLLDQRVQKSGGSRGFLGGVEVIRFETKALEICEVSKDIDDFGAGIRGPT